MKPSYYLFQISSGSPCNGEKGYCDSLNRCRNIATLGPMKRLKDIILSFKKRDIYDFFNNYSWACIGVTLTFCMLLALFIYIFDPSCHYERRYLVNGFCTAVNHFSNNISFSDFILIGTFERDQKSRRNNRN